MNTVTRLKAINAELLAALDAMVSCEYGTREALLATVKARAAIAKARQ